MTSTRVSTSTVAKICKQLSRDGIDIQTPSQAAIYKATFKEAAKLKEEMIEKLQMEQWYCPGQRSNFNTDKAKITMKSKKYKEILLTYQFFKSLTHSYVLRQKLNKY